MKYLYALIAFLPLAASANGFFAVEGGHQPSHLTPVDYPPDEYDRRIAEYLFLTDGQFGRFIVRPSFGAESCVSVHAKISEVAKQKHGGGRAVSDTEKKYFITVTQASESLWYSMDRKKRKAANEVYVTRIDREISLELTMAIQRVWGQMLQHTRYPAKASQGLDGITYQFSVWVRGLGDLHGQTWSPEEGLLAEFSSLGNALKAFAADQDVQEDPLIARLKAFESKIPKVPCVL